MNVILGVNHQFLYPPAMVDEKAHLNSLKEIVTLPNLSALDCWVWRTSETSRKEIEILKNCGKQINYNIGDRFGEEPVFPASSDKRARRYACDFLRREVGFALEAGAKKIIFGSGPDSQEDREDAKKRLAELLYSAFEEVPSDVALCLEPTDRDMDKRFLFGPAKETADFIRKMRRDGMENLGMLLDMAHIPLMRETMESAVRLSCETITHVHLGNNIVSNPKNSLYGDRHVPFGYPESEYTEKDVATLLLLLREVGYFEKDGATVSFELRPNEGVSGADTWNFLYKVWQDSIEKLA